MDNKKRKVCDSNDGFDRNEWDAISDDEQVALRKLFTEVHREAYTHMAALREAATELVRLDERVKKLTELVVGGEDRVLAMFGFENPFSPSVAISASSFEELLEATEEQQDYLLQFNEQPDAVFLLPFEEEEEEETVKLKSGA